MDSQLEVNHNRPLPPRGIRPVMDRAFFETVAATWEGSIRTRVIDGDLRETCQAGADGLNIIILGHGGVWSGGGQWM